MALLSQKSADGSGPVGLHLLKGWHRKNRWEISPREIFGALGPGFLVSVGYMDPGNWGTNLAAGAGYRYQLLWVILISNLIAIFLQISSAKLGIATGKDLAQLIREQFSQPIVIVLGIVTTIAIMATDMAEFLGAALGFTILFHLPLFVSALITGVIVMGLLNLSRWGYRSIEFVIIGLVSIVGVVYLFETFLISPDWGQGAFHTVVPQFSMGSILVAVGILGATVMPHNVFLHSFLATQRLRGSESTLPERRKALRLAKIDTIAALNVAFFVNAAMLIVAGTVFYQRVNPDRLDLQTAYVTLIPILGSAAAVAFGIGLLASGLSSSTTGTMAGQIVFKGFLNRKVEMWVWRLLTMIPALVIIWLNIPSGEVLVISQVLLSLQLPFTMVALITLTGRQDLMKELVDTQRVHWFNIGLVMLVSTLNVVLLWSLFA